MRLPLIITLIFLVANLAFPVCQAGTVGPSSTVVLPWTERIPFQYRDGGGKPVGILYDLGEKIFVKANVPREWREIPANRIALMMERDQEPTCLVGWFKTQEREKAFKVTLPIYQDKRLAGVMRADAAIKPGRPIQNLINDSSVSIVVKQGYSYGTVLDELIEARKGSGIERSVGDHATLLKMIEAKHASIVFFPQEEITFFGSTNPAFEKTFKVVPFAELSDGNFRHVICSKSVPDDTIKALNGAIKASIKLKS
jgi:uncharacterized protein (TIGR02285 family)